MEVVADYATPIPLTMIAELLGVPAGDQPQLVEWSHAMVRPFDESCTEEEGALAEQATIDFVEYVGALVEERGVRPTDDLLTALVEARVDGDRLTRDEVVATAILTLNAGHEATVQAIGNAVLALARHPDEYQRLRGEPTLIPGAVDEVLRFDTPLQMFERWVLEDLDWNGTALRRGTKVGLMFGSANHDEAVFSDPEHLDVGRAAEAHVSFGGGVHYCVGAPLAKVELEVALERFVESITGFELATDQLERTPSLIFRGVKELPITLNVEG
jgi:cytochrome P450